MMEWIDINNRLPEHCVGYSCIVYYENDCAEAVAPANYVNDEFCVRIGNDFKPFVGVTHWAEYPEPPNASPGDKQ